jgi:phage terminase small subunit
MEKKPPGKRLTPQQAKFVSAYLKTSNGTAAAIEAGYSRRWASHRAYDLLSNNPAVMEAVASVRKAVAETAKYDTEKAMEEARKSMEFARETGDASAMVKAIELRAKLMGLLTIKQDVRHEVGFKVRIGGIEETNGGS